MSDKPKFNVGDWVKVSKPLDPNSEPGWVSDMDVHDGELFVIAHIIKDPHYGFLYNFRGMIWDFAEDWLEIVSCQKNTEFKQ